MISKSRKAITALLTRKIRIECDHIPYEFYNVPIKKILNWIIVEASIIFKPTKPWGWPTHLQVEPTNICNLRCALCPISQGMDRPSRHMDFNIFKKIIDEMGDYVFLILLWEWGEPFLNPRVYEMISYAKQRHITVVSSTNGHVFAEGDHAHKLIHSGIDSIIFAMDGISQETYERYRIGGDLNTVIEGIKNVVAAKSALNSKSPFIHLRFIPMKHNAHEIPKLKDFARALKVDALTYKTLNPHDDRKIIAKEKFGNEFIPEDPKHQRFKYDSQSQARILRMRNPCKCLWNCPAIHSSGEVCPCTFDVHNKYVIGNIAKENFKEIWRGTRYRTYRRIFRKNYQKIPMCSGCSYAFEGGTLSTETIVQTHFFTSPL